jgi:S1-C subfamily serine protease
MEREQITQAGQDGSQCGIGVVFRMDYHGALVVDSLVPGGPAWESSTQGGLQVADVLQTVDGKNVYRCSYILYSITQTNHINVCGCACVCMCVCIYARVCVCTCECWSVHV